MIVNTFEAKCDGCGEINRRCATCSVTGTNAWGEAEPRVVTLCGPCRAGCRRRCVLHPKHKSKDWTPPPTEHLWVAFGIHTCCEKCGIVKRQVGLNGPCPGNVKV